ncbi:MAG: metallophosphoesterase [Chloroflexota bacterium]
MTAGQSQSGVSRRRFLRGALASAGLFAAGGAFGGYAFYVEPRAFEVTSLSLSPVKLPRGFSGLRIAQISDLHIGGPLGADYYRAALKAVADLAADLIVSTGDHLSSLRSGEAALLTELLSGLWAPLGVYAILGNHDYWAGAPSVVAALRSAGVRVLRNEHVPLARGRDTLYLAGLDDAWEGQVDLAAALAGTPSAGRVVLLAHEPDLADEAARDERVCLQLSGHTHGGQVNIPGLPQVLPHLGRKYPRGLYRVGEMYVYTNRGLGVVGPGLRLNCRPEITLLELTV